jgi:protein O-GlcNAc transferase
MQPSKIKALMEDAVRRHTAGQLDEAESLYRRARTAAPASFDAFHLSGLVALQRGRHAQAVGYLRRALRLDPSSALCEMRLGAALAAGGDCPAALQHLARAASRAPGMPEAWYHVGAVQRALGLAAESRSSLERAVALRPDYAEALGQLGALISRCEGFAAAVPALRRAAELCPGSPADLANLGVALAQSGGRDEALGVLDRALALDPAHALALTGRALVLQETYRTRAAVDTYGAVLERNPRDREARSGRLLALHYLDGVSRGALLAEHRAFDAAEPDAPAFAPANTPEPGRRIRVGFLSPDLRSHSVAYFLEPLLAHLDPGQFEVVLYHDHPVVDAMSERLRGHAALWRHVAGLPNASLEAAVRGDAPDILVDLAGHTGQNRLALFARRLAPVQVTYLGYPDTTGLREMDYRLVDAVTDPVGEADRFHSERLLRFAPTAWCYAPPDCAPVPARAPGDAVTFGCFNNFSKVTDSTLRCWSSILAAVPGSRLLLKGHGLTSPAIAERLRGRLARIGIDPDRVELAGRSPGIAGHLEAYGRVDVALDTSPYNGTTTTCEALWMGVPVVTLLGDRHASRVGASLLTAVGRSDWIAANPSEYVQIAVRLAGDAGRLCRFRLGLRNTVRGSVLMDHAGQAARLGSVLRSAWASWCAGRAAGAHIALNSGGTAPIESRNQDVTVLSA